MPVKRSKAILGLFSILIMMHHLAQKTSAAWIPDAFRRPGLGVFVPVGYLLVSFFFFCSGYGLIKSLRTKENYMNGFWVRRLNRILMIFVLTQIIYLLVRFALDAVALPLNPYSWFVYTIVVLYTGFFLIYRKKRDHSLLLMGLWILAYSVICYLLVKGNWWINTSPVFLLGICVADHEDSLLAKIRQRRVFGYGIPLFVFLVSFVLSENANGIGRFFRLSPYVLVNLFQLVFQILAGSALSLSIYLGAVAWKDQTGGRILHSVQKVLSFYGAMTLEFYLIHGLFVQAFSHHFISDSTPPVYYIKNVFLYVAVVFVLSTAAAFLLKKCGDLLSEGYKKSEIFRKFCHDAKKFALILLLLFAGFTVIYSLYRHSLSKDAAKKLADYRDENITYVHAKGTDVAAYVTGNGPYTLVFLGAESDACPTLSLRVLTDKLQGRYRCVILDYPGKGFSPDTDDARTTEYFADLIHDTLIELGEEDNIVLIPHQISAIYAYRYLEKHPENVAGFVGLSALVPELATHFLEGDYSSVEEYNWYLKRIIRLEGIMQKLMCVTGFTGFQMPTFEWLFYGSGLKAYYPVMEEMFSRHYMQGAHLEELKNVYENCEAVKGFRLPPNLPADLLLDYSARTNKPYGVDWEKEYQKMITGKSQSIEIINGDSYAVYYQAPVIAEKINAFLSGL